MSKAKKTSNAAAAGIQATSTTKPTNSKSEANNQATNSKDLFIDTYIESRLGGSTPAQATTAGRAAAGMSTTLAGNSAASRALASGDAIIDNGRVILTPEASERVGNQRYEDYLRTDPAKSYIDRVKATTASEAPLYGKWRSGIEPTSGSDWTSQTPLPTGGGDGAPRGQEDQVGRKPDEVVTRGIEIGGKQLTPKTTKVFTSPADTPEKPERTALAQYYWPENVENGGIRFQSLQPFQSWEMELIDRMNAAYSDRDFDEMERLRKVYASGENGYLQNRFTESLPEGRDTFDGLREAIQSEDMNLYNTARNELASNGFSQDQIDDQAAEMIHESTTMSTMEKESALQSFLGLTPSDATATSLLWWWQDSQSAKSADVNENGRVTQDELGNLLLRYETSGTLSREQAGMIWEATAQEQKNPWKKTYEEWSKNKR